jgi:fatty acid-binding protein DegV
MGSFRIVTDDSIQMNQSHCLAIDRHTIPMHVTLDEGYLTVISKYQKHAHFIKYFINFLSEFSSLKQVIHIRIPVLNNQGIKPLESFILSRYHRLPLIELQPSIPLSPC